MAVIRQFPFHLTGMDAPHAQDANTASHPYASNDEPLQEMSDAVVIHRIEAFCDEVDAARELTTWVMRRPANGWSAALRGYPEQFTLRTLENLLEALEDHMQRGEAMLEIADATTIILDRITGCTVSIHDPFKPRMLRGLAYRLRGGARLYAGDLGPAEKDAVLATSILKDSDSWAFERAGALLLYGLVLTAKGELAQAVPCLDAAAALFDAEHDLLGFVEARGHSAVACALLVETHQLQIRLHELDVVDSSTDDHDVKQVVALYRRQCDALLRPDNKILHFSINRP